MSILPEFTFEPPVLDQLLLLQEVLSQLNLGSCLSSLAPSPASHTLRTWLRAPFTQTYLDLSL